jgi:hypothetical protein
MPERTRHAGEAIMNLARIASGAADGSFSRLELRLPVSVDRLASGRRRSSPLAASRIRPRPSATMMTMWYPGRQVTAAA